VRFPRVGRQLSASGSDGEQDLSQADRSRRQQLGQVLPIFAIMTVVMLGGAALLTDVAWWWTNEQRMQRAADAGALAGAIYLPGNQTRAFSTALAEAAKNGYVHGAGGLAVTPKRDPGDPRKLIVDIDGPVGTNFARVLCWDGGPCLDTVPVSVTGAASYVLPVPMGSPQNYYGVGYLVDAVTTTTTTTVSSNTGWNNETNVVAGQWSNPAWARSNDNNYTSEATDGHAQVWSHFRLTDEIPNDPSLVIDGLRVLLDDARATGSGTATNCTVDAQISWDGGNNWSPNVASGALRTDTSTDLSLGSSGSMSAWGGHAWARSDFSDGPFQVRLTWHDGTATCGSSRGVRIDQLDVRVYYSYDQTSTSTSIEEVDVIDPDGNTLAPQNFWGAMQSQGAPNVQGDAYMTYYDDRTAWANADYDPDRYYHYGVEFPAGSSNGEVWLFDPGFCHVDSNKGTGEYWNTGGSYGYSPHQPMSTFYDLYDSRNTPYDTSDDILTAGTGNTFKALSLRDPELDVSNPVTAGDCSGLSWHNGWWKLADGLDGGKTYRLHSYSTDPDSSNAQRNTTAINAFAIWSKADGGTPRVYGLGAMEAYVRLPGGRSSEFYLAQIDREHAGKTMVVNLWDPGDTGNLAASLQLLKPTATSYQPVEFSYSATPNSHHGNTSDCGNRSGTGATSITTNTGGSSRYNGCWLTIEIPLPSTYTAPHPSSDTVTGEGGWWKIRYNMSGNSSDNSTDMTTWEVEVRGSPVHLVIQ
jgi:Flp pilus assembly protein TadG